MTPVVRLAEPEDDDACRRLESECRSESSDAKGAAAFFAEHGSDPYRDNAFTVVADVEGSVVGFATIHISAVNGESIATIDRVYVTSPARGVGIGDALIAGIRRVARERGCIRIDAYALPGDRGTKNLYERNGLTARLITASGEV